MNKCDVCPQCGSASIRKIITPYKQAIDALLTKITNLEKAIMWGDDRELM
jgi:hypothetical protein